MMLSVQLSLATLLILSDLQQSMSTSHTEEKKSWTQRCQDSGTCRHSQEQNEEHFHCNFPSETLTVGHYSVLHQCPADSHHSDISNMLRLQKDKRGTGKEDKLHMWRTRLWTEERRERCNDPPQI
ncbi:hypothetical protein Q7C36_018683 [Tachysurus vachellii]|uniref:Uncharacterized protein n=1 Tax=Tachysurus vachellii TaxID=175792 RepID=A0AA88S653_TACVA|nr:hypothetical protein Q7C36_018683 [Tachysurus vachellii]